MEANQSITTIANYLDGVVQSMDANYQQDMQQIWRDIGYPVYTRGWKKRGSSSLFTARVYPIPRETLVKANKQFLRLTRGQETYILEPSLPAYNATVKTPITEYINKVGVELEGGWENAPDDLKPDGSVNVYGRDCEAEVEHDCQCYEDDDGNIERCDCCNEDCNCRISNYNKVDGELEFGPYYPNVINWNRFEEVYPSKVNGSCGMHTHISFKKLGFYNAFVRKEFQPWLLKGLHRWGENNVSGAIFYKRLDGENSYCTRDYNPLHQIVNDNSRYSAVNYCYGKHGTMEIRVLPMFQQQRLAIAALKETYRLVHIWADKFCPKTWKPNIVAGGTMKKPEPMTEQPKLKTKISSICPHCRHDFEDCVRDYRNDGNWLARLQQSGHYQSTSSLRCCSCLRDLETGIEVEN